MPERNKTSHRPTKKIIIDKEENGLYHMYFPNFLPEEVQNIMAGLASQNKASMPDIQRVRDRLFRVTFSSSKIKRLSLKRQLHALLEGRIPIRVVKKNNAIRHNPITHRYDAHKINPSTSIPPELLSPNPNKPKPKLTPYNSGF